MTIRDCCISLKIIKNNLVVLGVMDMRQLLLKCVFLTKSPGKGHSYTSSENVLVAHEMEIFRPKFKNLTISIRYLQRSFFLHSSGVEKKMSLVSRVEKSRLGMNYYVNFLEPGHRQRWNSNKDKYSTPRTIEKNKILGAVLELYQLNSDPFRKSFFHKENFTS